MADDKKNNDSQFLNLVLIIAVALLVALVVYGTRFHNKSDLDTIEATSSVTTPPPTTTPRFATHNTIPKPVPKFISPLTGATHPPDDPSKMPQGSIGDTEAFKKIIKQQSKDLRAETASQSMRPNEKRALVLTEEEIQGLENSGRMIY